MSISAMLTRTRLSSMRTSPSTMYCTPSSLPIFATSTGCLAYCTAVVRAMIRRFGTCDRSLVRSLEISDAIRLAGSASLGAAENGSTSRADRPRRSTTLDTAAAGRTGLGARHGSSFDDAEATTPSTDIRRKLAANTTQMAATAAAGSQYRRAIERGFGAVRCRAGRAPLSAAPSRTGTSGFASSAARLRGAALRLAISRNVSGSSSLSNSCRI